MVGESQPGLAPARRAVKGRCSGFWVLGPASAWGGEGPRGLGAPSCLLDLALRGPCSLGPHFVPVGYRLQLQRECRYILKVHKGLVLNLLKRLMETYRMPVTVGTDSKQSKPSLPSGSHSSAATDSSEIHRSPHYEDLTTENLNL